MSEPPDAAAEPSERDRENAARRRQLAARLEADYRQCLDWAQAAFGPGWLPCCRHSLIEKVEEQRARREGGPAAPAAVVYTVKNDRGEKRHFTVDESGHGRECSSYQEGFGDRLLEPDLSRTIEVRGEPVHPHRYSLCWAGYDLYHPRSAEQLAALRQSRQRGKQERADRHFAQDNPLLAWIERAEAEKDEGEGQTR